ncbi:polysaccharide biosynthesis/export family protein, partial [bacterium]|nr:polysaccharide biosynthesis/export family protein [bacterium]MBU1025389.1 polysaccharide biosynthesis/export family protein [bacterium]
MKRKITFVPILIILACLFLPVSGFAQDAASSSAGGASTQSFDFTTEGHGEVFIGNYRLGPGDELTIRVFTLDPFEEVIKVSQDGKLILPVIGDLDVAGKTISELRELLTELYSEYYIDFSISIELTGVKQIQIYVFGNARTPGIYIVYANTTLLEFLQKIGLSTSGGNRRMIHHRKDVITEIDPFSMSILGEMEEKNMYLEFGDRIEIPQGQKSVSITGNVFRPGNYEVLEGETLIDILNLAGGPDPFADFNDTVIERPKADGSYERVYIDLEKILNGAEIIELVNRDRLYIP